MHCSTCTLKRYAPTQPPAPPPPPSPNAPVVLHPTVLHCTALHSSALHCTTLRCFAELCTALHCTALHYIALLCRALHCTAPYTSRHTALHCKHCAALPFAAAACLRDTARAAQIIHRDIKPGNLLVTAEGSLKVADFGVSYMYDGDDDTVKSTAGTAAFLAPEVCSGQAGQATSGKVRSRCVPEGQSAPWQGRWGAWREGGGSLVAQERAPTRSERDVGGAGRWTRAHALARP